MQELLIEIAKSLVDNPDEVKVETVEKENLTVLRLSVAKDDMGKVIGKRGKIAQAIRTVIKAASIASNSDRKVAVDIV
ncbi:MAG: KH domain-containing protein [Clostridia bacterium]|nr:KH domain-containing protein [Clostridia bacterium]